MNDPRSGPALLPTAVLAPPQPRGRRRRIAPVAPSNPLETLTVVILCGGRGVRMQHEVPNIPKPLVEIGGRPILWHVMRLYAHAGLRRFVLCLGYKGRQIQAVFDPRARGLSAGERRRWHMDRWEVDCRDTGPETNTGGRIKRIEDRVTQSVFFATYGDGLADVDLERLLRFHRRHGRIATITCVRPVNPFGVVKLRRGGAVQSFLEKPHLKQWINGGFFVFDRRIFDYLQDDDVLEVDTFGRLVADGQLMAYRHHGFWRCMDTYKDHLVLNQLWEEGTRPWAPWLSPPTRAR
jgi:glucose-1-phosphate cytidylyltransferase